MKEGLFVGIAVRRLHNKIGRYVSRAAAEEFGDSATAVHGWVIRYLYKHREEDVFQRDLETQFSVRRSTMTSILQLMEKKGLLEKQAVPDDKRLKKLILTPKAIEIQRRMELQIHRLEERMQEGITEEELATFLSVAAKLEDNLPS